MGYVHSGFVSYPVYAMNMNELSKWDKNGVDELTNTDFKPKEDNHTVWDSIQQS